VRHLNMGKSPYQAALDSAREISVPVLLATLTTVIVFLPLTFLTGLGKDLFTPLAVSAALAMFASYFVSRTVSPLYWPRTLRPGHEKERFPRWLLAASLAAAVLGLAAWVVLGWLQVPLPHLSERALKIVAGIYQGLVIAGGVGLGMALLLGIAPAFDRVFILLTA